MWRFLNSIPRAFRQQYHGPRASVGVHVEEGEQESQLNHEHCQHEIHDGKECKINFASEENCLHPERKSSLIHSVILRWNPGHEGFFSRYNSQRERTKEEKEEPWWKACRQDLCALLNGNHLLEILTVSAFYGCNERKQLARKKLLYRVLFSLSNGQNARAANGNGIPLALTLPKADDKGQQEDESGCCKDVPNTIPTPKKAENSPTESIESALKEFQDICQEYSSKSESLLGLEAMENGDMAEAIYHLKKACSLGNKSACFNIGLCYETGTGVVKNIDKAVLFYERAARHGHIRAMYNLGLIYTNSQHSIGENQLRGRMFIEEAAKKGLAEAQTQMGIYCMEQENAGDASAYFRTAADQKDCEAQYFLGICYEQGLGVGEDLQRAVQLYSQAASAGHEGALYNLAVCTELGIGGITADLVAAKNLFVKAAEAGNELAQVRLKDLETFEKQRQEERKKKLTPLKMSSQSSCLNLITSLSTPNLMGQHTSIASLFFSETNSCHSQQLSLSLASEHSLKNNNVDFFIGEDKVAPIFNLRNLSVSISSAFSSESTGYAQQSQSSNFRSSKSRLNYPVYGPVHKSQTSPNLSTMVACSI